jgi:hypothetical protein
MDFPWIPRVVRAALAVGLTGSTVYITITSGEVPQALTALAGVAIGYYFKERKDET